MPKAGYVARYGEYQPDPPGDECKETASHFA